MGLGTEEEAIRLGSSGHSPRQFRLDHEFGRVQSLACLSIFSAAGECCTGMEPSLTGFSGLQRTTPRYYTLLLAEYMGFMASLLPHCAHTVRTC